MPRGNSGGNFAPEPFQPGPPDSDMDGDRFLNDDRPLTVRFNNETRCASWQDCNGEVHVHTAYGSARKRYTGKSRDGAKKCAEKLFLEILAQPKGNG